MKANLKDTLKKASFSTVRAPVPELAHAAAAVPRVQHINSDARPHRAKTRLLGAHVDPDMYVSVRRLAAERGVTMLEVVQEAFADLLAKYRGA